MDIPVVVCRLLFQRAGRCKAVVKAGLEAFNLIGIVWDVVARPGRRVVLVIVSSDGHIESTGNVQLEESVRNLQHKDVGVVVLMTD